MPYDRARGQERNPKERSGMAEIKLDEVARTTPAACARSTTST